MTKLQFLILQLINLPHSKGLDVWSGDKWVDSKDKGFLLWIKGFLIMNLVTFIIESLSLLKGYGMTFFKGWISADIIRQIEIDILFPHFLKKGIGGVYYLFVYGSNWFSKIILLGNCFITSII